MSGRKRKQKRRPHSSADSGTRKETKKKRKISTDNFDIIVKVRIFENKDNMT